MDSPDSLSGLEILGNNWFHGFAVTYIGNVVYNYVYVQDVQSQPMTNLFLTHFVDINFVFIYIFNSYSHIKFVLELSISCDGK